MSFYDLFIPFLVVVVVVVVTVVIIVNFMGFYSKTTRPIPTKLNTKHPWVKGIQV